MKSLYSFNVVIKFIFLLITPVFLQAFNIGFIWHSIYWGAITFVVLIWLFFIVVSPLFGRIGCGWFCFIGVVQDIVGPHAFKNNKYRKPGLSHRIIIVLLFFSSAIVFYVINLKSGKTGPVQFNPYKLVMDFNTHYKHIWIYDLLGAFTFALLLNKRWICKICFMGTLCAAGANYSRLIPVVDLKKCNFCGLCNKSCFIGIPITDYISNNHGLITSSDCLICGKCLEVCTKKAIKFRFIWNRKKYIKGIVN